MTKISEYASVSVMQKANLLDISVFNGLTFDTRSITYDNLQIDLFGVTQSTSSFVKLGASTTAKSALNITVGVNPTLPNDGDLWWNGTNLFFRDGVIDKDLLVIGGIYAGDGSLPGDVTVTHAGNLLTFIGATTHTLGSGDDITYDIGSGSGLIFNNVSPNANVTVMAFETATGGGNHNTFYTENGVIRGGFTYNHNATGDRDDGLKFYGQGFATDGESIYCNGQNKTVVIPNGNLGIFVDVPLEAVDALGSINASVGYKVGGVAGVSSFGPSAVTSITVVGGIITAIS